MSKNAQSRWIVGGVVVALLVVAALTVVRTLFLRPFKVPTGAMLPTLRGRTVRPDGTATPGDHVFANSLVYLTGDPKRGDVVVFRTSGIQYPGVRRDVYFVKRIVAVPGDIVSIDPPRVVVNETPLLNPAVFDFMSRQTNGYGGYFLASCSGSGTPAVLARQSDRIELKLDEYLALGDNSASSLDGRYFGPIKRSAIVGKVVCIYYPFDRAGAVR